MKADPTRIAIHTDPLQRRMSGVTAHGHMHFDVPFMSEIADNLWMGGCDDGLVLPRHITHIVSLYPWEQYHIAHEITSMLEVRMLDAVHQDTTIAASVAQWVNVARQSGPVLVHCQAGLNRSGLVCALALLLEGRTPDAAIALLREKRCPAVLCNPAFEQHVRNYA